MKRLIKENSVYVARKLNEMSHGMYERTYKGDIPDNIYLNHNQGYDRSLHLDWILGGIKGDTDQVIITGNDTFLELALILARRYNDIDDISTDYLKRTITKSNVILLNGGLLPLKDLEVFSSPVIIIDDLYQDTITRIFIVNSDSIKFEDGVFTLEFTTKSKLGIIMDLQ